MKRASAEENRWISMPRLKATSRSACSEDLWTMYVLAVNPFASETQWDQLVTIGFRTASWIQTVVYWPLSPNPISVKTGRQVAFVENLTLKILLCTHSGFCTWAPVFGLLCPLRAFWRQGRRV